MHMRSFTPICVALGLAAAAIACGTGGGASVEGGQASGGATLLGSGGTTLGSGGATDAGGSRDAAAGGMIATDGSTATGGSSASGCPSGIQRIITVAKDGSGQYTTVQAAVNAIADGSTTPIEIDIKPGTYQEKVAVNRSFLCLTGQDPLTTKITFGDNANNGSDLNTMPTVNVTSTDVSLLNLSFENSTPLGGSQAIAVRTTADRIQFRNCRFLSYQDTLYTWGGTQYFRDCYFQGTVDYIFGPAAAVFANCTMYNASGGSAVTAASTPQGATYGYVFLGGQLTAASSVAANSVALGRPWRPYATVAYLNVAMGAHILKAGWTTMGSTDLSETHYSEYQSTGPGANPTGRVAPSQQLTAAQAAQYTVATVLGGWVPSFSQ